MPAIKAAKPAHTVWPKLCRDSTRLRKAHYFAANFRRQLQRALSFMKDYGSSKMQVNVQSFCYSSVAPTFGCVFGRARFFKWREHESKIDPPSHYHQLWSPSSLEHSDAPSLPAPRPPVRLSRLPSTPPRYRVHVVLPHLQRHA